MSAAIAAAAQAHGLSLHVDGARFANAVAHLGCHPADVTVRAGVDALTFGCVKNGGTSAEAIVFFAPDLAELSIFVLMAIVLLVRPQGFFGKAGLMS